MVNNSKCFKAFVLLLSLSAWAVPARAQTDLPDLGDYSATVLSATDEKKLGREYMREIHGQLDFIEDIELVAYLNRLGNRIAKNSDQPGRPYSFYLVKDSTLNAFAVPGGYVTVFTGLITTTQHEAELASVIAHELAHITQSHIARMITRAKRQNLPAMAAMIAAILLGGQAGTAAIVGTQAAIIDKQLRYSREFEQEADSIGINTLARAGYDPRAMPVFFNRLQQYGRSQESNAPEFLRTHPLTYARIAESNARAEQYPKVENPDETQFLLMQAKIKALYSGPSPSKTVEGFRADLESKNYQSKTAEQYGYALALMSNGEYEAARSEIKTLLKSDPDQLSYIIALAQIETADRRPDEAIALFKAARKKRKDDLVLDLYFIDTLIENKQYDQAKELLKLHLRTRREDPYLYKLLARAEGESGDNLSAHQALAEYSYYNGELREALRQLKLAEKYTGDSFYAQASVSARIEEIQQDLVNSGEK